MGNKFLYGKVVFTHNTTLLIMTNRNKILSYKLIDSFCKEKRALRGLSLKTPLPDYKYEITKCLDNNEVANYFRHILESSETKDASGEKYYEILSIQIF